MSARGDSLEGFGRFPRVWLSMLPELSGAERGVALALASYVDRNWQSRPGNALLAKQTGHTKRTVQAALKRLQTEGMIELVQVGGGRGFAAVYRLLGKGDLGNTLSSTDKVMASDTKRCNGTTSMGVASNTPTEKRTKYQQQQGIGGAAGEFSNDGETHEAVEHPVVAKVLDRVKGLGVDARRRIVEVDGIELVLSTLASRAKSGNNPAGLLIELVKTEAPTLIEAARAKAQRRQVIGRASGGVPESQRVKAEQEALLGPLSGDDLEALRRRVIDGQMEGRPRDAAERLGVKHQIMRTMMAELLLEERALGKPDTTPEDG